MPSLSAPPSPTSVSQAVPVARNVRRDSLSRTAAAALMGSLFRSSANQLEPLSPGREHTQRQPPYQQQHLYQPHQQQQNQEKQRGLQREGGMSYSGGNTPTRRGGSGSQAQLAWRTPRAHHSGLSGWAVKASLLPCLPLIWILGMGLVLVSMDASAELDELRWLNQGLTSPAGNASLSRRLLQEHREGATWDIDIFAAPRQITSSSADTSTAWRHKQAVGSWLRIVNLRMVYLLGTSQEGHRALLGLNPKKVTLEAHVDVRWVPPCLSSLSL